MNQIDLPPRLHEEAIASGLIRYCPVCDGYEYIDKKIGVVGCDSNGAAEALFLKQFSKNVTLMPLRHSELSEQEVQALEKANIGIAHGSLKEILIQDRQIVVRLNDRYDVFDVIYPALGLKPRTELASQLGATVTREGFLTDRSFKFSGAEGVWAAGDIVAGLCQISVAFGQGAAAATSAHNWLRELEDQTLP